jgi:nucleoside-diphosphate-sugar epimerase
MVRSGTMRALVTGAGGFLGRALVRALVARGDEVRALVRSEPVEPLAGPGVEVVRGDALDAEAMRSAVRGCDLVFHLAGVRRAISLEDFHSGNAETTRIALEACVAEAPGLRRFVLAGSLAASGPSATPRREEDPFAPAEYYGASKARAEQIALAFRDRLPVAVARPPRIMGPGDRENLLFFKIAARGVVLAIGGGERPLSWIDVDDCARGMLALADHPAAVGESFFLASPEQTSVIGLQQAIATALGVRARRIPVPERALHSAAVLGEAFTRIAGKRLPLNRKLVRQILAPGWVCDPGKARERLGFVAGTPLSASVARAAEWYRAHGMIQGKRSPLPQ